MNNCVGTPQPPCVLADLLIMQSLDLIRSRTLAHMCIKQNYNKNSMVNMVNLRTSQYSDMPVNSIYVIDVKDLLTYTPNPRVRVLYQQNLDTVTVLS